MNSLYTRALYSFVSIVSLVLTPATYWVSTWKFWQYGTELMNLQMVAGSALLLAVILTIAWAAIVSQRVDEHRTALWWLYHQHERFGEHWVAGMCLDWVIAGHVLEMVAPGTLAEFGGYRLLWGLAATVTLIGEVASWLNNRDARHHHA